jgi:DNA-directed RNA polymerase specialized sigma24 family protein
MAAPTPSILADYPPAFRERLPNPDGVGASLWTAFVADPSPVRRAVLAEHFTAYAVRLALSIWRRKRRHDVHTSARVVDVDELVGDASLALMMAIDCCDTAAPIAFLDHVRRYVSNHVQRELQRRLWPERYFRSSARNNVLRGFRKRFIRARGRRPNAAEKTAYLASLLNNPNIDIDPTVHKRQTGRPELYFAGDADVEAGVAHVADDGPAPDARLMDRETIGLALKGLRGDDRRMFKLVMDGLNSAEIAREMGIPRSSAYYRARGLIWDARCRADLARHLDCPPTSPAARPETARPPRARAAECEYCGDAFAASRTGRTQRYCKNACRLRAFRERRAG